MKTAIITLPLHTNYGGLLQAYALKTALESLDNEGRNGNTVYKIIQVDKILPAHAAEFSTDYTLLLEEAKQEGNTSLDDSKYIIGEHKCVNPRCITSTEQELEHMFKKTASGADRCVYCEAKARI